MNDYMYNYLPEDSELPNADKKNFSLDRSFYEADESKFIDYCNNEKRELLVGNYSDFESRVVEEDGLEECNSRYSIESETKILQNQNNDNSYNYFGDENSMLGENKNKSHMYNPYSSDVKKEFLKYQPYMYAEEDVKKRCSEVNLFKDLSINDRKPGDITKEHKTAYMLCMSVMQQYTFCNINQMIVFFNGKYYEHLDEKKFTQMCLDIMDEKEKKRLRSFFVFETAYNFLRHAKIDTIEIDKNLICFNNCIVNIQNLEVYSHDIQYVTTFCVNADYLDDIDKDSLYGNMYYFPRFLNQVSGGNEEIITQIWQMIANSMLNMFHCKKFYLLGKAKDSGKSLLGELIRNLIGKQYVSQTSLEKIDDRFALSELDNKFIIMGLESRLSKLSSGTVVRLKQLTGEKELNFEKKGINKSVIENRVLMIFGTNDDVSFKNNNVDAALIERMIYIPFDHSCPREERDNDLIDKLMGEIDMIATYGTYIANDLCNSDFEFYEARRSKEIKKNMLFDPISQFIEDNLEYINAVNIAIPTRDIYDRYMAETGDDITRSNFTREIAKRLPKCEKKKIRIGSETVQAFIKLKWRDEPIENVDTLCRRKNI